MNPRDRHLIALVEGGATLGDAGRVYGITAERVRQIVKAARSEEPPPASEGGDLFEELARFKGDLRAGGLRESTTHSYVSGATLFVRWLAGDYVPGPGRAVRR